MTIRRTINSVKLKQIFFSLIIWLILNGGNLFAQIHINLSQNSTFSKIELENKLLFQKKFNNSSALLDSVTFSSTNFLSSNGFFFPKIILDSLHLDSNSYINSAYFSINIGKSSVLKEVILETNPSEEIFFLNQYFSEILGKQFLPSEFQSILDKILQNYDNSGFPFAKFVIEKIDFQQGNDFYEVTVNLNFERGKSVLIDKVVIDGNEKTQDSFILKTIRIHAGDVYSQREIDKIQNRLLKLNFFQSVKEPKLLFNSDTKSTLFLNVKEKSTNYFDGILGYVPKRGENPGYFTGFIEISLKNLFGTGRAVGFSWKKLDRFSQDLQFNYLEPWVFSLPIDLSFSVNQRTQDTTYIRRQIGGEINYIASDNFSAGLLYSWEETIPFEDTTQFTVYNSSFFSSGIKFTLDYRDDFVIFKNGIWANLIGKYSQKEILGPEKFTENVTDKLVNQYKIELDLIGGMQIYSRNLAYSAFGLRFLNSQDAEESDFYKLGGTNSVRGYRENQFLGNLTMWTNLEYRFLLAKDSFAFLFLDYGYYFNEHLNQQNAENYKNFIYGYGVGISFQSNVGLMKFSFALGEKDEFSDGKIHFGLSNRF